MDRKKRNILSLVFSLAISCAPIIIGIRRDWCILEFVIGIASFFMSGLIISWNNELAFRRNLNTNHRLGYSLIGSFCFILGGQWLCGNWEMLLKGLGAVLTITGAVLIRLAYRVKRNPTE